jgi:DICT domain-containing protein
VTTEEGLLTIGELARRTGLTSAALRTWEARHGFPVPERSASGHRRYREKDVASVRRVLQRQRAGVRLDVAIGEIRSTADSPSLSIFAMLRADHPQVPVQSMRKSTLLALSRSIEDEYLAGAVAGRIFGSFQAERFYRASEARWVELARRSRSCTAFADFAERTRATAHRPGLVPLAADAPMRREWAIVAEAPGLSTCLAGWEPPGQDRVTDRSRRFDVVWTVDPMVTRSAAQVCLQVAGVDVARAEPSVLDQSAPEPVDPVRVTALVNRTLGYVDRLTH